MKNIIIFIFCSSAVLASEVATITKVDILLKKGEPAITIFIDEQKGNYQINNRINKSKKDAQLELHRLASTFGPDLPVILVVTPQTTTTQLYHWLLVCQKASLNAVRVYISSDINWKSNPQFSKLMSFDPLLRR